MSAAAKARSLTPARLVEHPGAGDGEVGGDGLQHEAGRELSAQQALNITHVLVEAFRTLRA